jgi:hypothetical protein
VKMWAGTCLGKNGRQHIAPACIYWTRKEARNGTMFGQAVIPITITYDDGKRRRRPR